MEVEVKIGDHVSYFSPRLGVTLKGTVVEVKGVAATAKLDKPIEYFTVDKYDLYRIEEGSNGNS